MKNKLLWFLLSLLGFGTACSDKDSNSPDDFLCAYGTPSATFSVKGKVTDEEGKPIPGIEVSLNSDSDIQYTDAQGNFEFVKSHTFHIDTKPMPLCFTDIDGPENGSFESATVDVQFTKNPDVQSDSWYQGDFSAQDVAVSMKRAEDEANE